MSNAVLIGKYRRSREPNAPWGYCGEDTGSIGLHITGISGQKKTIPL